MKYKNNPKIIASIAENNSKNYEHHSSELHKLGTNDVMLDNIEDMKNKMKDLETYGLLDPRCSSMMIDSFIRQAIEIQTKPNKSLEDICNFYTTYNNFNDTWKALGGDVDVSK